MELGLIRKIDIDHEMQQSYLDYAMSVIVSRALPDARDGLKPVQRRILYAMYDMGLRPDSAFKKSARIVGEVLGKYHPHGDMAVYEAMARQAQDFSMRYLLVDGQGNFGSVDGDPPAAMRYTEARLAAPAIQMLKEIEKDTVDFAGNFDDTLEEPTVLPAALPNLLVNGATGIAVGMATNVPPHNLGEVIDALTFMLEKWEKLDDINVDHLMHYIHGPDFPTGGVIIQDPQGDGLTSAYGSGRGKVVVQARAHVEEMGRGRSRIIVTELPYMTNKASLIERIAELVREGHLEGIADLRDESDRQGMRIVIELKQTADSQNTLRELYHRTPMQSTFGITLLALVEGEPRLLSLKQALRVYLEHRLTVVRRRSEFDLARARQRAHILEGLRVALKNLDEIIDLIRNSTDVDTARTRLMKRYKLSEVQTQAILDMQLRRLAALERKKIELEYKEVLALIKELEGLLKSPRRMRQVVADELLAVKEMYGDRRRTHIVTLHEGELASELLTTSDLLPSQMVWVSVSADGQVVRSRDDDPPRLSGREAPRWVVHTDTRHTLYLATRKGLAAAVAVHAIPEGSDFSNATPFFKLTPLKEKDELAVVFALPPKIEEGMTAFILTVTRGGMLKKSAIRELPGPSSQQFTLVRVNEGDSLMAVHVTAGESDLLLVTGQGMAIRFAESEVRPMGLVAAGVAGIKLAVGDEVAGSSVFPASGEIMVLCSDGKGKRIPLSEFPRQGRYGQGVIAWKLAPGSRVIGVVAGKGTQRAAVYMGKSATKNIRLDDAPVKGRAAGGGPVLEVKPGDLIAALAVPWDGLAFWQKEAPGGESKRAGSPAAKQKKAAPQGKKAKPAAARKAPSGKKAPPTKAKSAQAGKAKAAPGKTKGSQPTLPGIKPPKPAGRAKKTGT